jgi:PAS domain S-box-containing protein
MSLSLTRVLVIGCGTEEHRSIQATLEGSYTVLRGSYADAGGCACVLLSLASPPTEAEGFTVLLRLRAERSTAKLPIIAVVDRNDAAAAEAALGAGADDVLFARFEGPELLARVRARIRGARAPRPWIDGERDASLMVELTRVLTTSLDVREILQTVVTRVAAAVRVDRCSIVVAREAGDLGYVLAASDDPRLRDLPINLDRYPEIQRVLQTLQPLVIDDPGSDPMFWEVRAHLTAPRHPMLTLVPIACDDRAMGVLFLRASEARGRLDDRDLALCEVVANATAVALRNVRTVQQLREERIAVTSARVEAEQRVQLLERYADVFQSSADGMVVIDHRGRVLFANPRSREITGHTNTAMLHVISPADRPLVRELMVGFRSGVFPSKVDVRIRRRDGVERVVSLSTSSVLRDHQAVLVTFRDVTEERATEHELARTRDFLTLLIEASPDAIIAARLDGALLLCNSAAERVLGYTRDEIVGRGSVEMLYPPRMAREVMRRIKAAPEGRIAGHRTEVLSRHGERVPVVLSAGLVRERGVAVATVGIFADIRERLRMEERLAQVQQQLAMGEKQAIVVELAGAAAHELNQPLTAIQGYAELLQRKAGADSTFGRGAAVILRESERMAEIVRKLGKIARYETKPYVGGANILDLDRATDSRSTPPPPRQHSSRPPPSPPPSAPSEES